MKKTVYTLLLLIFVLCSCRNDIPMVNLGLDNSYAIERMRALILHPEFPGEEYHWSISDTYGKDSLVSTERDYIFISEKPGEYKLKLNIIDAQNPVEHYMDIIVWEEQVAYSRYISKVYEYRPAPGQFINELPLYEKGDTEESMRKKVQECLLDENDEMVSLGGFGGYITFGFDHTVVNVPGKKDFKILGNAFYAESNPNPSAPETGGSSEPGIVMVSFDRNGNGIPDDEWYELAGSEYYKPQTIHNYQITYYKPDTLKNPTPAEWTPMTDTTYIAWESNYQEKGYIVKLTFHTQDYYPKWIPDDKLTFTGTKLADNATDESGNGSFFVLYSYDWGYVDNHPNNVEDKISFDIDWAVDKQGNKVHLPGVDFIRVYTGVNQQCGWLGETSTEISRAEDLHIENSIILPNP